MLLNCSGGEIKAVKGEIRVRSKLDKRLQQRVKKEVQQEYVREITSLKKRDDFSQELEYFLDVLSLLIHRNSAFWCYI